MHRNLSSLSLLTLFVKGEHQGNAQEKDVQRKQPVILRAQGFRGYCCVVHHALVHPAAFLKSEGRKWVFRLAFWYQVLWLICINDKHTLKLFLKSKKKKKKHVGVTDKSQRNELFEFSTYPGKVISLSHFL